MVSNLSFPAVTARLVITTYGCLMRMAKIQRGSHSMLRTTTFRFGPPMAVGSFGRRIRKATTISFKKPPAGRYIIYREMHPDTKFDLWVLPLAPGAKPFPFLQTEANEYAGVVSPDG